MRHIRIGLSLAALCLVFFSGASAQQTLHPTDKCQDHADSDIVTFADESRRWRRKKIGFRIAGMG